ncbi:hypothetical protein Z045_25000 [Rhodococcus pyridinivorans KG-16]|uniref:NADPH-dependent FMN reductase-like domain-containing protein n=1 Tax=Rhodococcus pyridinivorans KG-16 TaxID=1441730 RepID=A0A0V9UDM5_9NOCA|nr:NAD(P)H-dependent oxidoreductase [Rhodococcus pyridinivorans]KSZ56116.1 hypothetical protein Z045_25000 [Rhodococcus pyridinivorans KG-16]
MKITVLVGNPKPMSRTLRVAQGLAERVSTRVSGDVSTIDLAHYTDRVFAWPDDTMTALTTVVASSDLAFIASPTYKAAYTGLLKSFLDRYPANGLKGVMSIPVMTGADAAHALAPAMSLTPVLTELGAMVPCAGMYFKTPEFGRVDEVLDQWLTDNSAVIDLIMAATSCSASRR